MGKKIKKAILYLLAFCLLAGTFAATAAAAGTEQTLFDAAAGTGPFILLPPEATESETDAANYLKSYLEEITSVKPDTVSTLRAVPEGCVISLSLSPEMAALAKGSYRLRWGLDAAKARKASSQNSSAPADTDSSATSSVSSEVSLCRSFSDI